MFRQFFTKEPVNTGRQSEIDLFKAICIIAMIGVHVFLDLGPYNPDGVPVLDHITAIVGATAFMACMGIGMRYSRHQSAKFYVIRGIGLLTVGQMLNLLRNSLPNLIAWWITGKQVFIANSLLVLQADIMTFAGLAFFLMALFKKLRLSDGAILAAGFAMNVFCLICWHVVTPPSNFLTSQALGYLIVTDAESYFPLLSYFVFVAFGYLVGGYYPRISDKDRLSTRILQVFTPICAAYYALRILTEIPFLPELTSDEQYSLVPATDAIGSCLAVLLILALLYKIIHRANGRVPKPLLHISEHINGYYCVSYLLIMPVQTLIVAVSGVMWNRWVCGIYAVVVLAACMILIRLNDRYWHINVAALKGRKMAVFFVCVWVLTFAVVAYAYPRITEYATMWNNYLLP